MTFVQPAYTASTKNSPMCAPKSLNLLILSDIHFGSLSEHPDFALADFPSDLAIENAVPVKANLIERVSQFEGPIDAILVPGDLTSKARPDEFLGCQSVVREIASAIGVTEDRIFFTFGNHDVNWKITQLSKCSGNTPTAEDHDDLDYLHAGACLGNLFVQNTSITQSGPLPGTGVYDGDAFQLVIANTGFYCHSEQEVPHGRLGIDQLNWLRAVLEIPVPKDRWRVLMLHHHPANYPYPALHHDLSTLAEGSELMRLVGGSGVDFVCHGHRHHPIHKTLIESEWVAPVTILCAGSVAVNAAHRANGHVPNVFHIVSLERRAANGAAEGHIHTYQYSIHSGWQHRAFSAETPMNPVQSFGSSLGKTEAAEILREMLHEAQQSGQENTPLCDYADLPWDLKCWPFEALNDELRAIGKEFGLKIVGSYPKDIMTRVVK